MADHTENLIAYIKTHATFSSVHVGEVIPQSVSGTYVWIQQSGEQESDCLNNDEPESTTYDVEVVADDIADCRAKTTALKAHLRAAVLWSVDFEVKVQTIRVEDHGDDYIPTNIFDDQDNALEVGALIVTLEH